ncbi:MAG: MaoC/PaaZ C-terminal domain-containing protein [Deltaproteobacteria bacterium]|nr:MaoC/PaaZ C-terminal domain-containing protein [Deltaproteobacteria bacterium]
MAINTDLVGKSYGPTEYKYTSKDTILYALGVGSGPDELNFVYENDLKVLPTFGVIPAFPAAMMGMMETGANPMMVVHGEQGITLHRSIPDEGTILTKAAIEAIYDKGSGAVILVKTTSTDEKGEALFDGKFVFFARGEGGFGGDRGPSAGAIEYPDRDPDFRTDMPTLPIQALMYRLSGDLNPLHADPNFAKIAGFDRPILHGLGTYGHAGRAVLSRGCGGDPARFKSFEARFSGTVFPGDTIITEGWALEKGKYLVRCKRQTGDVVLSNGIAMVAA